MGHTIRSEFLPSHNAKCLSGPILSGIIMPGFISPPPVLLLAASSALQITPPPFNAPSTFFSARVKYRFGEMSVFVVVA